ncbi:nitronate monooxygenase [Thermodesulfobacteriota bacterium]
MFRTELCDLLGIKYPIIQGAMGVYAGEKLIAAVSEAGGLGTIAAVMRTKESLHDEINKVRKLTNKPFAVNIAGLTADASEHYYRVAKGLIEVGVEIVTTGRSDPRAKTVQILKEHDIIVLPVVPSVDLAKRVEEEGADGVIASGTEAGGHVGSISTFPLLPQVVDAVNIPVVAAGGIGDGRGLLAALALGASGIQMGTRFIGTKESNAPDKVKEIILKTCEEETTVTTMITGKTTRVIKDKYTEEWEEKNEKRADHHELSQIRKRNLRLVKEDQENATVAAGQIVGMIKEIKSVREILEETMMAAEEVYNNLARINTDNQQGGPVDNAREKKDVN